MAWRGSRCAASSQRNRGSARVAAVTWTAATRPDRCSPVAHERQVRVEPFPGPGDRVGAAVQPRQVPAHGEEAEDDGRDAEQQPEQGHAVSGHAAPAGAHETARRDRPAEHPGRYADRRQQPGELRGQREQPDDHSQRRQRADPHPAGRGLDRLRGPLDRPLHDGAVRLDRPLGDDRVVVARLPVVNRRPAGLDPFHPLGVVDLLGGFLVRRPVTVYAEPRHGRPPSPIPCLRCWGTQRRWSLHRTMGGMADRLTEYHPMEYADFSGEIPAGEYGGGRMTIYDRGTYTTEKWRDNEVIVVLDGERGCGRYLLFQTRGKDWKIHPMDGPLPEDDDAWGYELDWPGVRALAAVSGGRLRLTPGEHEYPLLRPLGEALAPIECLLDGVVVAFDRAGTVRPPTEADQHYLAVDLLWLDGVPTLELPYERRRELLADLGIAGPRWQTPPHFPGGGEFALAASADQGTPGVLAKRLDSPYQPGRRSRRWLRISR